MQPGMEKLPGWLVGTAPILLLAIILLGGFWLQKMEKKARAIEKQHLEGPPE